MRLPPEELKKEGMVRRKPNDWIHICILNTLTTVGSDQYSFRDRSSQVTGVYCSDWQ